MSEKAPDKKAFTPEEVSLRRMTIEDLPFTLALRNDPDTRRWFYDTRELTLEGSREWFRALDTKTQWYFIAEVGGEAAGTEALYNIDWERKRAEVGSVMVLNRFRGTNLSLVIGRKLFELARAAGLRQLFGDGYIENARAQRQAAKLGFAVTLDPEAKRFRITLDL